MGQLLTSCIKIKWPKQCNQKFLTDDDNGYLGLSTVKRTRVFLIDYREFIKGVICISIDLTLTFPYLSVELMFAVLKGSCLLNPSILSEERLALVVSSPNTYDVFLESGYVIFFDKL